MRFFFVLVLGLVLAAAGAGYLWVNQPFVLAAESVDVSVEPGMSAREVAATVAQAGVAVNPVLLHAWFRLSGQSRQIRAGSYELDRMTTPTSLLQKLVREGKTFADLPH